MILATAVAAAVAASVGMSSGDWLGGATRLQAAVMGVATLAGSTVPALPVALVPGPVGYAASALFMLALAVTISEIRAAKTTRPRAYTTTLTILAVASGLSIAAALLVGAS